MIKKLLNNATDGKEIIDVELIKPTPELTNSQVNTDEKPIVRFGMLTLIIGFGGFLLWSAIAPLDEGVPGTGIISVDTKRKTIQHLRGGLVESIAVREGDRVKTGDVLLRLNDTDIKAQLDITRGQYAVVKATEARLLAERDGKATVTFSPALLEAAKTDRRTAEAISAQGQLFAARKSALSSELGTVDESIVGLNQQIIGLQSIEAGKKKQIDLILKEANSYRSLVEEGFVPRNKLYELERVLADLSGTRGGDLAQIARAQASINEMKLRKLQRIQDFRKEVETQMSDVQKEVGNQSDRLTALTEEFERSVIKAPTDGTVVGMEAHTVGGVIRPGDRIMDIVPEGDVLIVEAQLPVNLIDKVRVGQLANMHLQIVLSGGAQPAIEGRVAQISADRLTEPRTGNPYYSARIQITENGEAELLRHKIQAQPGMQVDVVIVTGARTVLQYLLKPLMSRVNAGMKEQ
jgi:HlyD family type I secretion membrane fusion protein